MLRRDFVAAAAAVAGGAGIRGITSGGLATIPPEDSAEPLKRVGHADVRRFEDATATLRGWYYRAGGGVMLPAATAQLRWLVRTNRHAVTASAAVRRGLLVAVADLGSVVAWAHFDAERYDQARRLWLSALGAARRAGESCLVGSILRQLADQALHRGRPREALELVRLGYQTTTDPANCAPGLLTAHLGAYEAWCHAAVGDLASCDRAQRRAEEHFERNFRPVARGVGGTVDDGAPPWLADLDRAEFTALRGHAYHILAETSAETADTDQAELAAARAEPLLTAAVTGFDPGFVCGRVLNTIGLSASHFQQRDGVEQGVEFGNQALAGVAQLSSSRCRSRLRSLITVTEPYADLADVADLRERLRQAYGSRGAT